MITNTCLTFKLLYFKLEFPPEEDEVTQDESEVMEDEEDLDELEESMTKDKKSIKRKAPSQTNAKSKACIGPMLYKCSQ